MRSFLVCFSEVRSASPLGQGRREPRYTDRASRLRLATGHDERIWIEERGRPALPTSQTRGGGSQVARGRVPEHPTRSLRRSEEKPRTDLVTRADDDAILRALWTR